MCTELATMYLNQIRLKVCNVTDMHIKIVNNNVLLLFFSRFFLCKEYMYVGFCFFDRPIKMTIPYNTFLKSVKGSLIT